MSFSVFSVPLQIFEFKTWRANTGVVSVDKVHLIMNESLIKAVCSEISVFARNSHFPHFCSFSFATRYWKVKHFGLFS